MKKDLLKRIKNLTIYKANKMNKNDAALYINDLKTAIKLLKEYVEEDKILDVSPFGGIMRSQ